VGRRDRSSQVYLFVLDTMRRTIGVVRTIGLQMRCARAILPHMQGKGEPCLDAEREALARARWWLKYEDDRRGAYLARAGWLLGFAGVIAAVAAAQAQKVLEEAPGLGSVGRPVTVVLLGLVAVAVAAGFALVVLVPINSKRVNPASLNDWESAVSGSDIIVPQLAALSAVIDEDAPENDKRLKSLWHSFLALGVALILLVAQVVVPLERTIEEPCALSTMATSAQSARAASNWAVPRGAIGRQSDAMVRLETQVIDSGLVTPVGDGSSAGSSTNPLVEKALRAVERAQIERGRQELLKERALELVSCKK